MSYYISPRFLDKLAVHITKNFMELPGVRVPLILGVHGRKGEGKSFQCELVFQHMGVEPVRMSAGELESPDAGDPVRLLRLRYREAAELIKVRGKMCVLLINDLDAGAGRVDKGTQYTVNTQLVNGTLMNIADNPTDVQLPGSYETQPIHRVPIIVTGNDFSTLYAPLIRDGRMEKFYWEPDSEDRIGIISGIFEQDRLSRQEIERLVENFPNQSIDFFGALRSRLYDEQVRAFIHKVGLNKISVYLANQGGPVPEFARPDFSLPRLVEFGNLMVQEQQRVQEMRLVEEYVGGSALNVERRNGQSVPASRDSGQRAHQSDLKSSSQAASFNTPTKVTNGNSRGFLEISADSSNNHSKSQNWPDNVSYDAVERLLEKALQSGSRLSVEVAKPREKQRNIWRSWKWQPPENVTQAMDQIENCLQENPQSFIRLVGYNPKTQTRTLEELIARA